MCGVGGGGGGGEGSTLSGIYLRRLFVLLVALRPSNMRVYLRDGSAQTILCATTLR